MVMNERGDELPWIKDSEDKNTKYVELAELLLWK